MKNIFKTLLFGFGLILVQSCDDELNQLPNDSLTPSSYYTNAGEFENATRGIYSGCATKLRSEISIPRAATSVATRTRKLSFLKARITLSRSF